MNESFVTKSWIVCCGRIVKVCDENVLKNCFIELLKMFHRIVEDVLKKCFIICIKFVMSVRTLLDRFSKIIRWRCDEIYSPYLNKVVVKVLWWMKVWWKMRWRMRWRTWWRVWWRVWWNICHPVCWSCDEMFCDEMFSDEELFHNRFIIWRTICYSIV